MSRRTPISWQAFCGCHYQPTEATRLTGIEELGGAAIIREVHVYGPVVEWARSGLEDQTQHSGLGTRLIREAENRARATGYDRLAVISALGTRRYYLKQGFRRGESVLDQVITGGTVMNLRVLLRWMVSIVIAVGLLGVIGLALNPPVQARVTLVYDWPGVSLPCNASLQQCIDAAVVQPGDTIRIKPGIYTQSVTLAKPVSLIGDGRATTVLNAEPGQRVLTVTGSISFTTVISGLTFKDGNAAGSVCPSACGGGVLIAGAARPTLQNIALVNNTAAFQGGGLWVEGGPVLKLVNAAFISNTAGSDGGGLYFNGPVQLVDGRFEYNSALGFGGGGGLFVGELQANGTELTGNTTSMPTAYGGGAYVSAGVADLNLVQFQGNSTAGAGGALYGSGPVTLTSANLVNNQAELAGGGVYAGGTLFLLDSQLENNVSRSSSGGGAFTQSSAVIVDSVVVSNSAALQGGGLQAEAGANLLRAEFVRNVGAQRGGGLDVAGSLDIMRSIFIQQYVGHCGRCVSHGRGRRARGQLALCAQCHFGYQCQCAASGLYRSC